MSVADWSKRHFRHSTTPELLIENAREASILRTNIDWKAAAAAFVIGASQAG
jgi:hypothetical protein